MAVTASNESDIASLHNLRRNKEKMKGRREVEKDIDLVNNIGARVGGLALGNAQLTTLVVAKSEEDAALRNWRNREKANE